MSGSTTPGTFGYTGASVTYTVPATSSYYITASGAQGGASEGSTSGGLGAEIGGEVTLTAGEALTVAVGGQGHSGDSGGGGGGGSFVVGPSNTPLVVAGGGSGASGYNGVGDPGQTGTSGSTPPGGGAGGTAGTGGAGGQFDPNNPSEVQGGGGGGFSGGGSAGAGGGGGGSGFPGLAGGSGGSGGGGGYSGGGGSYDGSGSGGGGSLDSGTNQLLVSGENGGNGSVTITQLFASTIAVSGSGQTTTTGTTAVTPFTGVSITDPNGTNPANPSGPTDTVTVTPSSIMSGALSDNAGGTVNSSTGTYTASGTATQVDADLAALTFTPAAGQSGTTTFTIADTNWAGLTSTPSTASVVVTAPLVASTISVPASDQSQTSMGLAVVTPFKGVAITDPNAGSTSETVTVTPSTTGIGTLADPSAASDGSSTNSSTGAITLKGSASTVTTELDALTFTPAYGQSGQTTFTIADTNSANLASTPATAAVTVNLPTLTTAQLGQVGGDLIQFYKDTVGHASTTADASKLATDFTSLDLSQAELGQLLGQTLTSATLAGTAASTLGTDIANLYYPKITADLAHSGQGLANDLTSTLVTTAGAGGDDLLRLHSGQSAATALAGTVADFKLA